MEVSSNSQTRLQGDVEVFEASPRANLSSIDSQPNPEPPSHLDCDQDPGSQPCNPHLEPPESNPEPFGVSFSPISTSVGAECATNSALLLDNEQEHAQDYPNPIHTSFSTIYSSEEPFHVQFSKYRRTNVDVYHSAHASSNQTRSSQESFKVLDDVELLNLIGSSESTADPDLRRDEDLQSLDSDSTSTLPTAQSGTRQTLALYNYPSESNNSSNGERLNFTVYKNMSMSSICKLLEHCKERDAWGCPMDPNNSDFFSVFSEKHKSLQMCQVLAQKCRDQPPALKFLFPFGFDPAFYGQANRIWPGQIPLYPLQIRGTMAEMKTLYTDSTKSQGGLRQRAFIEIKKILGFEASSPEHFSPVQLAAGFDRMAHDFFGGKPVLEDHDYTKLPSLPHSSVYTINYDLSDRSSVCNTLDSLRELFVDHKLLLEPFLVDLCAVNRIKNMPEFHHQVEGIFPYYGNIKENMEAAERLRRAISELVDKFKKGGLDNQPVESIRGNINALTILRAMVIKAATAAAATGTNLEEQPITTADDSSSFDTQQAEDTPTSSSRTISPEKGSSDPTDIKQDQPTEVVVEDDGSATAKKKSNRKKSKKTGGGEQTNTISLGESASKNLIAGADVGRNEVEDEVIENAGSATPPSKIGRKRKTKASQGEPKTVASSDAGGGLDDAADINSDQLGGPNLQNTEFSASEKKLPRKDKGQRKYCAEKHRNVPVSSELDDGRSMVPGVDVDAESAQTPPSREHNGLPVQSHEINGVTSAKKKVGIPATQAHQSSTVDSIPDTNDGGWEIVETKSRSSKGSLRGASNPLSGHSSLQNQKPLATHPNQRLPQSPRSKNASPNQNTKVANAQNLSKQPQVVKKSTSSLNHVGNAEAVKSGPVSQKEPSKLTERVYIAEDYPAIPSTATTSSEPQQALTKGLATKPVTKGIVLKNEPSPRQDFFDLNEGFEAHKNAPDMLSESTEVPLVDKSKATLAEVEKLNTPDAAASDINSDALIISIEVGESKPKFGSVPCTISGDELSSTFYIEAGSFKENVVLVNSTVSNQSSLPAVYAGAETIRAESEVLVPEVPTEKLTLEISELSNLEVLESAGTTENSDPRSVSSQSNSKQTPDTIFQDHDIVSDVSRPHTTNSLHGEDQSDSSDIIHESSNAIQKASPESNLSWADERVLTSPTKFKHGLRRSSIQFGDNPTEEERAEYFESLGIRRRSNSVLDEPLRKLQFGDMPKHRAPLNNTANNPLQACDSSQHVDTARSDADRTFDGHREAVSRAASQIVNVNPLIADIPHYSNQKDPAAHMYSPMDNHSGTGPLRFVPPQVSTLGYVAAPFGYSTMQSFPPGVAPVMSHHPGQNLLPGLNPPPGFAIPPQFASPSIHHAHPPTPQSHSDAGQEYQAEWHEQQARSGPGSINDSLGTAKSDNQSVVENQAASSNQIQIHADFYCTFCSARSYPTPLTLIVFCFGCGPHSNIRYCSIACCLAHSYHHARFAQCLNYPQSQRLSEFHLPSAYIFEPYPILSLSGLDSPEKFRQKVFSMYCRSGPFPEVMRAWAKQYPTHGHDLNETQWKKTGDYYIFRSSRTLNGRAHSTIEVICTIKLHRDDFCKQVLNRVLNACFLENHPQITEFLFRMLRHTILNPVMFELLPSYALQPVVFTEFLHQFGAEFGHNAVTRATEIDDFDFTREWGYIYSLLDSMENKYPILLHWRARH